MIQMKYGIVLICLILISCGGGSSGDEDVSGSNFQLDDQKLPTGTPPPADNNPANDAAAAEAAKEKASAAAAEATAAEKAAAEATAAEAAKAKAKAEAAAADAQAKAAKAKAEAAAADAQAKAAKAKADAQAKADAAAKKKKLLDEQKKDIVDQKKDIVDQNVDKKIILDSSNNIVVADISLPDKFNSIKKHCDTLGTCKLKVTLNNKKLLHKMIDDNLLNSDISTIQVRDYSIYNAITKTSRDRGKDVRLKSTIICGEEIDIVSCALGNVNFKYFDKTFVSLRRNALLEGADKTLQEFKKLESEYIGQLKLHYEINYQGKRLEKDGRISPSDGDYDFHIFQMIFVKKAEETGLSELFMSEYDSAEFVKSM